MNESLQDWNGHGAPAAAAGAEALRLSEALSAWMDGEALPAGIDQEDVLQWLLHDAQAQQKWQCWHAGADCLCAGSAVDARRLDLYAGSAVGSAAWNQRLQQALAEVPANRDHSETARPIQIQKPADSRVTVVPQAANDPVWRWKMAAGFASVAALGVMVWSLLGQQPTTEMPQQVVAVRSNKEVPTPRVPPVAQTPSEQTAAAGPGPADSPVAADPYTESLMLAHAQLGENILFQDVLSTE